MPFDIWSDLALTALCGTALITWIGRDLAARARQWRAWECQTWRDTSAVRAAGHAPRGGTPRGGPTAALFLLCECLP